MSNLGLCTWDPCEPALSLHDFFKSEPRRNLTLLCRLPQELISEASILLQLENKSAWELEELKSDPLLMLHFVAEAASGF